MKTVTFDEARAQFERVFQIAAAGETIVIQRDEQRVALRSFTDSAVASIAPPGYFSNDYSATEIAELNSFAAKAPQRSQRRSKSVTSCYCEIGRSTCS